MAIRLVVRALPLLAEAALARTVARAPPVAQAALDRTAGPAPVVAAKGERAAVLVELEVPVALAASEEQAAAAPGALVATGS